MVRAAGLCEDHTHESFRSCVGQSASRLLINAHVYVTIFNYCTNVSASCVQLEALYKSNEDVLLGDAMMIRQKSYVIVVLSIFCTENCCNILVNVI